MPDSNTNNEGISITLFICYSQVNLVEKKKLVTHLKPLEKLFNVELWHDEKIAPGAEGEAYVQEKLKKANIFLFLVSADSLASDYLNQTQLAEALRKKNQHEIVIIPILIRPCDWQAHEIKNLQVLPKNEKPLEDSEFWKVPDKGYAEVAMELRHYIEEHLCKKTLNSNAKETGLLKEPGSSNDEMDFKNSSSPSKSETMHYRQSWTDQSCSDQTPLHLQTLLTFFKESETIRTQIKGLDCDLSGFRYELSAQLNQLDMMTKNIENYLNSSGNGGHRLYRLALDIKHHSSITRNQLLKAGYSPSNNKGALLRIKSKELIYLDHSIEKFEAMLNTVLKEDFGLFPN